MITPVKDVKRPLKFFDIAMGRSFTTAEYQVVEVVIRFPHGVAPRRSEIKAAPLSRYL